MNFTNIVVLAGMLRIHLLSHSLIRIEEKGPKDYEDRCTFNVVDRNWPGVQFDQAETAGDFILRTAHFRIAVSKPAQSVADVKIFSNDGALLFDGTRPVESKVFIPSPSDQIESWAFADEPRIVPPPWGTLPPPEDFEGQNSGWDLGNQAKDVYVFIPGDDGYPRLVKDFLKLTGPVPIPPLAALGLIDSRYYPYRQDEALNIIRVYRARNIPLDVFVLDTDWRVGASHGYGVNEELLPDIRAFFKDAHANNVRVMLNDHPEPVSKHALDPKELKYRQQGLTSLLDMGADFWWFDRNWHVTLRSPAEGLAKEVWGMRVYHDIAHAYDPSGRGMIMSNVEGVDNGFLNAPPSPAAHRYPVWWTGDTRASWDYLERGVRNAVNMGARSLLPYVSEDLGGHHDTPDPELYLRFLQFGTLSPICRLHCSYMLYRFPWMFGEEIEDIASEYIRLRYKLLPTFYSAARKSFEEGLPIVRRCDLYWPEFSEAASDEQYLLGDDLLVAPILQASTPLQVVKPEFLSTADGERGLAVEYFGNVELKGKPLAHGIEPQVNHGWFGQSPAPKVDGKEFSARWQGLLGPVPETGVYRIGVRTDDGTRLWLDGKLLINEFDQRGSVYKWMEVPLEAGKSYPVRLEYRTFGSWHTMCELLWGRVETEHAVREVWIPPGTWFDAWSGKSFDGPKKIKVSSALHQVPMFLRGGGVLFSIPLRQHTGAAVWTDLTLDCFAVPGKFETARELYEDDGKSSEYLAGKFLKTIVRFSGNENGITIRMEPGEGNLPATERRVRLRIHGLAKKPSKVLVNGKEKSFEWKESSGLLPFENLNKRVLSTSPVLEIDGLEQDSEVSIQR